MKYLLATTALLAMIGTAGAENFLVPNVYTFIETPWGSQPVEVSRAVKTEKWVQDKKNQTTGAGNEVYGPETIEVACPYSTTDEATPEVTLSGLVVHRPNDGDYLRLSKPLRDSINDCHNYSEVPIAYDPEVKEWWSDKNVLIHGKLHLSDSGVSLEVVLINSTVTIPVEFTGKWCSVEDKAPTWSDGQINHFRPCSIGDTPKRSFIVESPTKITIADRDFCRVIEGGQLNNTYNVTVKCTRVGTKDDLGLSYKLSRRGTDLFVTDNEE